MRIIQAAVALATLLSLSARAEDPIPIPTLIPEERRVLDALKEPNPASRQAAAERAIRDGLGADSLEARFRVLGLLGRLYCETDLRPYGALIAKADLDPRQVAALLDRMDFYYAPRVEQVALAKAAMLGAPVVLSRGSRLTAAEAIWWAGRLGLWETEAEVGRAISSVERREAEGLELKAVRDLLRLKRGSSGELEGNRLAAARITSLESGRFEVDMSSNDSFASAVLVSAREVCKRRVIDGRVASPEECAGFRAICDRTEKSLAPSQAGKREADAKSSIDWLSKLRSTVGEVR